MKLENTHLILVMAPDSARAGAAVQRFFDRTQLVHYDRVELDEERTLVAAHPSFWAAVEAAVTSNHRVLQGLIDELKKAGVRSLDDLAGLPQGYQSKLAHTVTHLLDGFFGVDSFFYNLVEDSHWLSEPLVLEIRSQPEEYYLLTVRGELLVERRPQLVSSLRSFEA